MNLQKSSKGGELHSSYFKKKTFIPFWWNFGYKVSVKGYNYCKQKYCWFNLKNEVTWLP